jgi:hypothetical protein
LDYKHIYNNKQNQNLIIMGCGCKNNGNNPPAQPQNPQQVQQAQQAKTQQNESVKSAIKKTVEKYYNVNKTNTNG